MSTQTTNYNLIKPELTDAADITATNTNWDTLDTKLKNVWDKAFEVVTENRALVSDGNGSIGASDVTSTELGYVSGVTSPIQTQLNSKQSTVDGAATTILSEDLTGNRTLVSDGSGKVAVSNVTSTELGYLSGTESNVQDQIDTVFQESKEMVGDIMLTAGEIQEGWVEVNGGIIDKSEHPGLYKIYPYSGYVQQRTVTVSTTSAGGLKFFKKQNGYYVGMIGGTLFWRQQNETTYQTRTLTTTLIEGMYALGTTDIMWDEANNQWLLAVHVEYSRDSGRGYIKLYSMPTLDGVLTKIFDYSNNGSGSTPVGLKKIDSYYFYKDASYDNVNAMNNRAKMNYTTNPNGTWNVLSGSTFGMSYSVNFVDKINGRWFIGGAKVVSELIYPAFVYSGLNQGLFSATWTLVTLGDGISTDKYPARYHFVNNIVYMPNCGAYLFATGEQADEDVNTYYSYDLSTCTKTANRAIGGELNRGPKIIDSIFYTTSGAYRDDVGMTGDPLTRRFEGSSGSAIIANPRILCDDMYLTYSGTTGIENITTKSLPTMSGENGRRYKIKADGVPGTGG